MALHYDMIYQADEPERPCGLFAVNRSEGRLDMVSFDRLAGCWRENPAVSRCIFGDCLEIGRATAQAIRLRR